MIDIIKEAYGFNTKEAKQYLKSIDEATKEKLLEGFYMSAKKSFLDD